MPNAYFYSSTAGSYLTTGSVTSGATAITLNSVTGLPASFPFKMVLEPGTPSEEIIKVTSTVGTTLTVVRGWDGTSAIAHANGITARHMMTAEDLTLSRTHETATAAHGTTGAIVGTTDAQALTNKNLNSATNTFPTSLVTLTDVQVLSNKNLTSGTNTFPSSLATLTGAQALTNKDLTSGTNTFPTSLATLTGVQTLTNKTLNAPALSAPVLTGAATAQQLAITAPNSTTIPLSVKGGAGTTVDIFNVLDSGGNSLTKGTPFAFETGTVSIPYATTWGLFAAIDQCAMSVTPPAANVRGLLVQGKVSQTANLQEWRDSAKTLLAAVDSAGKIWAPALAIGSVDVPKIKIASYTATTDASGFITTTHGFGFTPTAVMAYCNNPTSQFAALWGVEAIGATTFRTRWLKVDGTGGLPSSSVSFTAIAFG